MDLPSPQERTEAALAGLTNWCVNTKKHLDMLARIYKESLRLPQEFTTYRRWERELDTLVGLMSAELALAEPETVEYLTGNVKGAWPHVNRYDFLRAFPTEYLESYL